MVGGTPNFTVTALSRQRVTVHARGTVQCVHGLRCGCCRVLCAALLVLLAFGVLRVTIPERDFPIFLNPAPAQRLLSVRTGVRLGHWPERHQPHMAWKWKHQAC